MEKSAQRDENTARCAAAYAGGVRPQSVYQIWSG